MVLLQDRYVSERGGLHLIWTNEKLVMLRRRSGPGGNKVGFWAEKESEPPREVEPKEHPIAAS